MKKYWVMLIVTLLLCLAPSYVYAGSLDKAKSVEFSVTGGLDMEKDAISTFDVERIVSGTAEQGATVGITINIKNVDGQWKESSAYSIEVGSSGIFTQTIPLKIGENQISFLASKTGRSAKTDVIVVKRKPIEIKKELEKVISIPGGTKSPLL